MYASGKFFRGCTSIALIAGVSLAAIAQDETKSEGSILFEEITVTAQRREQNAQDVGISVTALSGNQIRALGFTNAQEITALAPGVSTVQPNGEANYSIAIRGVSNSDFTTNVESPIAVYVDETYISQTSGAGFLLFDLERVEVLRGPQGTLFGRNATGGLVHYITVKPSQEELNGYGAITYGRFNRTKAEGAVGFPITDKISARMSLATHQGGGYVENRLRPGEDLNNANETAGRLQLLFEPSEKFDVLLNARFGRQDIRTGFFDYESAVLPTGTATPGAPNSSLDNYVDLDGDVFAGDYDRPGRNHLETYGLTSTINWDLSFATLTSITDHQSIERDYIEDSDASPVNYFNFFLTTDAEQFSQELRLAGSADRFKWLAGFYYLDLNINDSNGGITPGLFEGLFGDTVENLGYNGLTNPYQSDSESWSVFGQIEYDLTKELTLIGGFRYISEDKDFGYRNILTQFPDTAVSGSDPNAVFVTDAVAPYTGQRSDNEWSARVQLDYKPQDDLLLYASWNRGVKSGGFNAPLLPTDVFVTDAFLSYDPEVLNAFEAGFKWDVAKGLFRVNGSAYYYDYNNYQAFSIIGLDTFTLNSQAENKGFELEIQAAPAAGLDIQLGVGYIDADVTDVPGLTVDVDTPSGTAKALLPGETVRPVQTPKWNINGLIRYEVPVGDAGSIAFQTDGQYRSDHTFALTGLPAVTEQGYFLANASVTWLPDDADWNVRFFVQNLTDNKYRVQAFDLSGNLDNDGLFGLIEQYYGRPLIWGISLNYTF